MRSMLLTAVVLAGALAPTAAQAQTKRAELQKTYSALTAVHGKAVRAPGVTRTLSDGTQLFLGSKYNPVFETPVQPVQPVQPGFQPVVVVPQELGIKVWAQPVDGPDAGKFVHLEKYKWQRKQRFYLWFETSTPVYVGLYQDYAGLQPSRKVLPDERFPQSYSAILPGQRYRFPIMLEMDDNLIDEFMAIEVVNAASGDLRINTPTATVCTNPGCEVLDKGVKRSHEDYLARKLAESKRSGAKFNPSTPEDVVNPGVPPVSTSPEDVAIIAVGREGFGHIQLRLKKD